jgi:hypothetical protein
VGFQALQGVLPRGTGKIKQQMFLKLLLPALLSLAAIGWPLGLVCLVNISSQPAVSCLKGRWASLSSSSHLDPYNLKGTYANLPSSYQSCDCLVM